jgi:hypothetical protein
VLQHPKVSLEPQYYLPAIPKVMAKARARVAEDLDHLLPGIHQRPFVISTSTRGIANMVTNANTATRSIIGTRGRTKMARVEMADHQRREGHKPLEARRITTVMDG